jgi:hypothetical protein
VGTNRVDFEVVQGVVHGFGHESGSGKVHDCVGLRFADYPVNRFTVSQIAFEQGDGVRHGRAMAAPKIVDDDDLVAGCQGALNGDAADIPGAAGDQDSHPF